MIQPPTIVPVSFEEAELKTNEQIINERYALALVNETYWAYEQFRTLNHDRRWSTHDSLYFGYVPPRVWDGSNVARASFTRPIVYEQVETALPAITNAIFGVGAEWFQVDAEPGTDPKEAIDIKNSIAYVLEHPKDDYGSNSIAELRLAIKNTLLYGNGGVSIEWNGLLNRPVVEWVDIRDFYIDPGLQTPDVNESSSIIRRKFLTIDEILKLKEDKRFNIPSKEILWYMAKNVPQNFADQTKRVQEALRGVYYSPGFSDFLPNPADRKVEVLIYYSKSRIIWVFNKEWVAYNGPNPYGFIPFAFAPYSIVPSRFYAQSIADVQENNQRYTEALMNAHYDELTLLIHPPRVQKRNTLLTPAQQKWRPGAVFSADNKDDISLLQVNNSTVNVFDDVQMLQMWADKLTGINSMAGGGIPAPSNANRTLGGLQMQSSGSGSRISDTIYNIELYLIVPTLYKIKKLLEFHTRPGEILPAINPDGNSYSIAATNIQKKVQFRMLASTRMVTKDKLMQIFPFWMQAISQGGLMDGLKQTGQTIDFQELFRMLQDATGVGRIYQLVRPLNDQEQKAMQQPDPKTQADMQKAQMDAQTRNQIMDKKTQSDEKIAQIKQQPKPPDFWQQQMDQQKSQQELQIKAQMAQQELEQKKQVAMLDMIAKHKSNQMDLMKKQADVQVAGVKSESARQQAQADHQMKMAQMAQQMQMATQQSSQQQSDAENFPLSDQGGAPQKIEGQQKTPKQNPKRPTKGVVGRNKQKPPQ